MLWHVSAIVAEQSRGSSKNLMHHSSKPVLMHKNERRFRDAVMPDVVTDGTKRYEVPEKWKPANIVR